MPDQPNRFVLVDESGRVYDRTGIQIDFSFQDGGLTLKAFIKPASDHARANARHLTRLSESLNLYDGEDNA